MTTGEGKSRASSKAVSGEATWDKGGGGDEARSALDEVRVAYKTKRGRAHAQNIVERGAQQDRKESVSLAFVMHHIVPERRHQFRGNS